MKKAFLLAFSLVVILTAIAQQKVVVTDSAFTSDDRGQTLQLGGVNTSTYNPDCKIKTYGNAYVDLTTNQLINSNLSSYDYYPNDSLYHITAQILYTGATAYSNYTRETFTYTAAGGIATDLNENWDGVNSYIPSYLTTYTYNASGQITEIVAQTPNDFGVLANYAQTVNEYDAYGHLTKNEQLFWDPVTNAWIPSTEVLFVYNANGYLLTKTNQDWSTTNTWMTSAVFNYYNNSKGLPDSVLIQHPDDNTYSKQYISYYASTTNLFQQTQYDYQSNNIIVSGSRLSIYHDSLNSIKRDSIVSENYEATSHDFQLISYVVNRNVYNPDNTVKTTIAITSFPAFRLYVYNQDNYGYAPCASVVPVTLLSFSGEQKGNDALLQWQTANETNTSYFNIQRSLNGVYFTTIGKVKAGGNSAAQRSYAYTDANIGLFNSAKLYYRLATTDNDGSISYSKTAELTIAGDKLSITISPNPFTNAITIYLPFAIHSAAVRVSDISGKIVYASQRDAEAGSKWPIDASHFAKGTYFITVQSASDKQVFKVVK